MSASPYVFAFDLSSADVIVHDTPKSWQSVVTMTWPDGSTRREAVRTRCGGRDIDYLWRKADGEYSHGGNLGTLLLTRHAVSIGAHFCRRCWPNGVAA